MRTIAGYSSAIAHRSLYVPICMAVRGSTVNKYMNAAAKNKA